MSTTIIKSICLSLIVILSTDLLAQPIASYERQEMYNTAEEQMDLGDYYNALEWYRKIYKEEKTAESALSIGYAYYKMRDYKNAERWYSRVLDEDVDNAYIDDRYIYGRVLRANDKVEAAAQELQRLTSLTSDDELRALANMELQGMAMSSDWEKNEDVIVRFEDKGINSGSGEYSPVEFDDETLYFSSFNRRKEIILNGEESDYHAKLYRRGTSDKGELEKPEALPQKINRPGYHVSGLSFSKDRRTMYFARQTLQNDNLETSVLYFSRMGAEDWSAPEPLPVVNGDYLTMQPAVGELFGNEVLFFVSDRDGGMGGLDIYYSSITGAGLSAPVNLGEKINTPGDDISPFYHDGHLYWSTDGRPGMGNYDLHSAEWDGNDWSDVQNMGRQYNTRYDDYSLSYNASGSRGYLVSNRPDEDKRKLKSETCCYDIYAFDIKELKIDLLVGVGHVVDDQERPLNGATVELYDRTLQETESQTQDEEYRFGFGLFPERRYEIITSKEGYISDTVQITTRGIVEDTKLREKVVLKVKSTEPELPEYTLETVTINEPIRLNNIYYNFEKWDILPDAEQDLQIILDLMNEYGDMVIELSSHTDSRGTTPYNKNLSQKRAQSAKDWLLQRGIADERIKAVGYGESKILNRCVNGVRCDDEEHRYNRRTEFKIIEGPQTIQIRREVKKDTSGKQSIRKASSSVDVPVIEFKKNNIDLGTMKAGEKKQIVFDFVNTGTGALKIDLATACKCTDITWPTEPVAPGEGGRIVAIFDSSGMSGQVKKTIDIIANTDPIVVEAKFSVLIETE